jgi:hypothetical protein
MPSGKGAQERRRLKRLPLQHNFENSGQQGAGGSQLDASLDAGAESNAVTPEGSPPASAGDGTAPRLRGGDMKGAAALIARQWGLDNHLAHSAAAPAASPQASRSRSSSSDEPVEDTALASSAAVAAVGGPPRAAPQNATPATSFSRRKGPEERAREAREAEAQRAAAGAPGAAAGPSGAAQNAAQDGVAARSEGDAAEACGAPPDAAPATPSTDGGSAADGLAIDVEEIRSDSEKLQGSASNSAVSAPQHKSAVPKLNLNALVCGQDASLATSSTADSAGAGSKKHQDSAQKSDSKEEGDVPPLESEKVTRHAENGQPSLYIAASKTQSLAAQVLVRAG